MDKQAQKRKANYGVEWVRSKKSGNSYLCPAGIKISKDASDEELRRLCVEESNNPENS